MLDTVTALLMTAALAAALFLGFQLGRRTNRRRVSSWRQRTSRIALGRQMVGLLALVAVGRFHRTVRRRAPAFAGRRLPRPNWR